MDMRQLQFSGEITLDQVFDRYRVEIYDQVVKSIKDSMFDKTKNEITAVTISINHTEYSIHLTRDKFIKGLQGAISFYESLEEYEKCQVCLDMINELKGTKLEKENNIHGVRVNEPENK